MRPTAYEINQTVHFWLEQCIETDAPIARLVGLCDKLRSRPDWNKADVVTVETAVRRMLEAILVGAENDQDDCRPDSSRRD